MELTALFLSRIQFAFTVSFHIIFPSMSIGLAAFLVVIEFLYLRTREEIYLRIYRFWSIVFALGFGMGVVTGLVMSFQFGTNFSRFAQAAGPVIGPIIGLEVVSAFFLEAGFLGIMLFGWGRVGEKMHLAATAMVSLGTTISAGLIMSANSWMHTPAGVTFDGHKFTVIDWWAVVFNPSYPYRFIHMLFASWITAAFFVAGISAWYLLRRTHLEFARRCFSMSMTAAAILLPLQLFLGDLLALEVIAPHQTAKIEAIEGFWDNAPSAPWNVIVIPDQQQQRNKVQIGIPYLGSILVGKNLTTSIPGLKNTPREKQPQMWLVFYGFRLMFILGTVMFCAAMYGLWLRFRGRLYTSDAFHRLIAVLTPAGFLCVLGGWICSETGRQPYTVFGYLTTTDSLSPVPASSVALSLIVIFVVYMTLLAGFLVLLRRTLLKGPLDQPLPAHPSGSVKRGFIAAGEVTA